MNINNIIKELNKIKYGFKDENGNNIIFNEKKWNNFYQFYYLLSPVETLNNKCGVCWDQVELERYLFEKQNITVKTYFIYLNDHNKLPSHTFLTFEFKNKFYWFEHSWEDYKGIHEYDTINNLLLNVKIKFTKEKNVYIYNYDKPKFGLSCQEFYDFVFTQKLIYGEDKFYE